MDAYRNVYNDNEIYTLKLAEEEVLRLDASPIECKLVNVKRRRDEWIEVLTDEVVQLSLNNHASEKEEKTRISINRAQYNKLKSYSHLTTEEGIGEVVVRIK